MTFGIPTRSPEEIEYPSSDGQPMAETSVHAEAMAASFFVLARHFESRADVNVGMNLLFYYEQGNPGARFSPDVYVSIGAPKGPRRVYKLWEEPVPPTFVLELSSRGTWLEDTGNKQALCAKLGVQEYFLFDPEADYLNPPLQGFRLAGKRYAPIVPDADGTLRSETLGLELRAEVPHLRFIDANAGTPLLFPSEIQGALAQAESRSAALEARSAALEARSAALEAELARLRGERDK